MTRVGPLDLRAPQDREGRFSMFERHQRSEKALVAALAEMYVQGVGEDPANIKSASVFCGSVSRADEVVCAFVGGVGFEDISDRGEDVLPGAAGAPAEEVLELGEDLLDRVEVGAVGREEEKVRVGRADRRALVHAEIVEDRGGYGKRSSGPVPRRGTSPERSVGTSACSTQARNEAPSIAPSISIGASIRSWRRPARKVMVLRLPKGALPRSRAPFGPQPRSGAMLVRVQVSFRGTRTFRSTKTSRRGSIRPW